MLAARVELAGASVLDLYAGSGALGLEALSRGAAAAVFVESDQRAAAVIAQNITTLGVAGATLRRGTVASVLTAGTDHPVDLVLADPPYDVDAAEIEEMLSELTARGWAATGTVAVVERAASGPAAALAGRVGGVAGTEIRRHPAGDGSAGADRLTCPATVIDHERRGMSRIVRPGDPRPHRHLRTRGRPVRRGHHRRAGQPQQVGHVRPRRTHRDDRRVDDPPAQPARGGRRGPGGRLRQVPEVSRRS